MRHTAATLWLASGEAPEWIARQLGHTSTEMLFRVYSRYVPNLTRRDGSAMERLLKQHISLAPVTGWVDNMSHDEKAQELLLESQPLKSNNESEI
jgi:integrase